MTHKDVQNAGKVMGLTPRETDCLRLVAQHRQTKEIARELKLTPNTVNSYIKSACDRLGVASRREAAERLCMFERHEASCEKSQRSRPEATEGADVAAWIRERVECPGPRVRTLIAITMWASFALAATMLAQALIGIIHGALHPHAVPLWPSEALAHRRIWPDIFYTGAPLGRLMFALCFFVPGLALLRGDAALRLAAWTTLVVLVSTMSIAFGPVSLTVIDALQLAVYVSLLKLTRQLWIRVVVGFQVCTLGADISFFIEGVIDGRTWDLVQVVSILTMTLTSWASMVIPRDRLAPLVQKDDAVRGRLDKDLGRVAIFQFVTFK